MKNSTLYSKFLSDLTNEKSWKIVLNGVPLTLTRSMVQQLYLVLLAHKTQGLTEMRLPIFSHVNSCILTLSVEETEQLLSTLILTHHTNRVAAMEKIIEDIQEDLEFSEETPISPENGVYKASPEGSVDYRGPSEIQAEASAQSSGRAMLRFNTSFSDTIFNDDYTLLSDKLRLDDYTTPEIELPSLSVSKIEFSNTGTNE